MAIEISNYRLSKSKFTYGKVMLITYRDSIQKEDEAPLQTRKDMLSMWIKHLVGGDDK